MPWHIEPVTFRIRRYRPGESFAERDPYQTVGTVDKLGRNRAYLSGFLNKDITEISRSEWRELRRMLREQYEIQTLEFEHNRKDSEHETGPAPLE